MLTKFKINGRYYQKYNIKDGTMKIDFNNMPFEQIIYFLDWADKGDARDIDVYEKQHLELDIKIAKNCTVTIVGDINQYCYILLKYVYISSKDQ